MRATLGVWALPAAFVIQRRKDGTLIDIREMNDYHLQNSIAMCDRMIAEREQAFQRKDLEADHD